ncbi:MAG: ATP-binding cassette domain-containing protein [Clostridia bacterium]
MIQLNDLTKKYGESVILSHANYAFPQRGLVCLMGASGTGKTTLFHLLAGFDTDYEGTIVVGGTPITGMRPDALCAYRHDNIGFVFQDHRLLPGYTVLENVTLSGALSRDVHAPEKAMAHLAHLGLAEKATQSVETLSGGQKQRVAIARALMGNPQIIFADEPTSALDRKTSSETMRLLREIAQDKLVLVITHDAKICDFADEVIHLRDQSIVPALSPSPLRDQDIAPAHLASPLRDQDVVPALSASRAVPAEKRLARALSGRFSAFPLGAKNFKVHFMRYLAVSLAVSIGLLAFLFSLSFGNVTARAISDFQEKNTAFNAGSIKGSDDGTILSYLAKDERIESAYYQYKLTDIDLALGDAQVRIAEKFPGSKASESLSYGVMPRRGRQEIALTPSLARKLDEDIARLIGKALVLTVQGQSHTLSISGIFNAAYDDFFVSADVEAAFYQAMSGQPSDAICYEVRDFSDVVAVSNGLKLRGLTPQSAVSQVYQLQTTFARLRMLFGAISALVLLIGLLICAVLLVKLQNTRYHEVGLLAALGFSRGNISRVIAAENCLLSLLATASTLLLLGGSQALSRLNELSLCVTAPQLLLACCAAFSLVILLSALASRPLLRLDPAKALQK